MAEQTEMGVWRTRQVWEVERLRNAGYSGVKIQVRIGSGRVEYEGKQKNIRSYTHVGKEKQMKRMHRHAA